jgi:hypothetical protein
LRRAFRIDELLESLVVPRQCKPTPNYQYQLSEVPIYRGIAIRLPAIQQETQSIGFL